MRTILVILALAMAGTATPACRGDGDGDTDADGDAGFDPEHMYAPGDPCDPTFDDVVCGCDGEGWEATALLLCWGGVLELDTNCVEALGGYATCTRDAVRNDDGEVVGYLGGCHVAGIGVVSPCQTEGE